jgi:DNA primase
VVDVVGDFITLKRRGVNYIARCPFHDEKTPSFMVSATKNIYKCFGCGKSGSSVSFVMEHEKLSYPEAIRWLGKKYGIEIREKEQTPEDIARNNDRESMMIVSSFANSFFSDALLNSDEGRAIGLSYFRERGFSRKTVERFQLGYSPARRNAFSEAALKAGYKEEFLVKTGLSIKRDDGSLFDRFAGRVMFPIHSLAGRVIGFGGRILQADKKAAKYLNSPDSEIYLKRNVLYGIFFAKQAIGRLDKCYLVEGYTDVISMFAAGIENVVSSSGTSLTEEQIRLVSRFSENITVLFDGDAAGIKASLRGIDMLLRFGLKVKVVLLPDGDDPDSFSKKHSADELRRFLDGAEQDFLSFKVQLLNRSNAGDPLKKAEAIREIVNSISVIPDLITRSVYIKECSKALEIDENVLSREVTRTRSKLFASEKAEYTEPPARPEQGGAAPAQGTAQGTVPKAQVTPQSASQFARPDFPPDMPPDFPPDLPPDMPAMPTFVTNIICQEQEKELLMFMLRHGRERLFRAEGDMGEEVYIRVDEYIIKDVKNDDLEFQNLRFKQIFEEYERLLDASPEAEPETFIRRFINHDDAEVASTAINLLTDTLMQGNENYIVSTIWNGTNSVRVDMAQAIPKALAVYKSKVLSIARNRLVLRLSDASEDQFGVLEQIKLLDEQRKFFAEYLGRTIL